MASGWDPADPLGHGSSESSAGSGGSNVSSVQSETDWEEWGSTGSSVQISSDISQVDLNKDDCFFKMAPESIFEDDVYKIPGRWIWDQYDIDPYQILESSETQTVEKLFETSHFEKLGPIERRVQIQGQKFKVIENDGFEGSLYKALSHAVTGLESNFKAVQKAIFGELSRDWLTYVTEISDECGFDLLQLPSFDKPNALLSKYKIHSMSSKTGSPLFELTAASRAYKFNYVLIDGNNYEGSATVYNSKKMELFDSEPDRVYHFLRTGSLPDSWYYQFIVPIGPPLTPEDGRYPVFIYDVILIDRPFDSDIKSKRKTDNIPRLTHKPILCFGLDHRMYFYKPTYTHDLWSLLSEILFQKLEYAPAIYECTLKKKLEESSYYHFSKARKRKLTGRHGEVRVKEKYLKSLKIPHHHKGDTHDLDHAANSLKFSFTLIGLDGNGNFFWKEAIATASEESNIEPQNLAFFVRFLKNKEPYWYALECIGWNCVLERKLYGDITFMDDSTYDRELYYRARPCSRVKGGKINESTSQWGLILSKVNTGRRWLTTGVSRILTASKIHSIAHHVSTASVHFFNRLSGWFRIFQRSSKVSPEGKSFKKLYIRDIP